MKQIMVMGIAAAALLTASCSNDETVEMPKGSAISFDNVFVNNSTRATDLTAANLKDFKVWGFINNPAGTIFDGERVFNDAGTWEYLNLQYWVAGNTYYFTSIAPAADAHWTFTPTTDGAVPTQEMHGAGTVSFDNEAANGEQDLLYAWNPNIVCDNPATMAKVGLTFQHLLSRVKFTFKNGLKNSNAKLVVKDVAITDAHSQGKIDMMAENPGWHDVNGETSFRLGFDNHAGQIAINTGASTGTKYLIPTDAAQPHQYHVNFTIEVYFGDVAAGEYHHAGVLIQPFDMEMGKSYNIVAELNENNINPTDKLYPILFDVTEVEDWADFTDHSLYQNQVH